jgi:DNA-binding SARP family transcriptional activator
MDMGVELRLLGDVQAQIDGRLIELGHARQRCVLVALAVDAGRAVSVDQLIDRVWADRGPQRTREALFSYLSRLRQLFAAAPEVRIVRQPGGYLLTIDPMSVDLHRFQRLITQARAARNDNHAKALLASIHGKPGRPEREAAPSCCVR